MIEFDSPGILPLPPLASLPPSSEPHHRNPVEGSRARQRNTVEGQLMLQRSVVNRDALARRLIKQLSTRCIGIEKGRLRAQAGAFD